MSINQTANRIFGDYREFYAQQAQRLLEIGIDINGLEVSHLAFRTNSLAEYLVIRQQLESLCSANVENTWNEKPISKLFLHEPLQLAPNVTVSLIELIPPVHKKVSKLGLEHIGIVMGQDFDEFGLKYAHAFTGQQDQGTFCQPYFITFLDRTNVKFYRYSLQEVCILEGRRFDGFYHVVD